MRSLLSPYLFDLVFQQFGPPRGLQGKCLCLTLGVPPQEPRKSLLWASDQCGVQYSPPLSQSSERRYYFHNNPQCN